MWIFILKTHGGAGAGGQNRHSNHNGALFIERAHAAPRGESVVERETAVQVADAGPDGSCEHGVGCRVAAGDVGARGGLCGGVRGLQVRRLPLHRTFPPWGRVCSLNEESVVVI